MRGSWQLAVIGASSVAAWNEKPSGLGSAPSGWGSAPSGWHHTAPSSGWKPPHGSSRPGWYHNTTSTASEDVVWVTDIITEYTTICPATVSITSGTVVTTSTYLTTSTYTSISSHTVTGSSSSGYTKSSSSSSKPSSKVSSVTPIASSSKVSTTSKSSPVYYNSTTTSTGYATGTGSKTTTKPTGYSTGTGSKTTTTLPANTQVGNSQWGTLDVGCFPKWLPMADGTPYTSAPWGNKTTENADSTVEADIPVTGQTRTYDFTISRGRLSPDGVERDVILINGGFPGPAIEANWGDKLVITVHNNITSPEEGTSLHWHGQLQRGTPWADGVPAIGQCPIAPGGSFTYEFTAQVYGSSWYHAHYSAQYTGGVVGPMIIHGPVQSGYDYDCDIGPVMMSDWYHIPYFSIVADAVGTDLSLIPPTSDSNLIQGRNNFSCSDPSYDNGTYYLASNYTSSLDTYVCKENAPLSQFRFQAGKTHRLRLINHGADGVQKFRIDGISEVTIIAVDYVPVEPHTTEVVTVAVAQRVDILVTAPNNTKAAYWMRAEDVGGVTCGGSKVPLALAAIYNEDADTSVMPTTQPSTALNTTLCDVTLPFTSPSYSITPTTPTFQQDLSVELVLNATGSYEWRLGGRAFHANFNDPILFLAEAGNLSYPDSPQWNVYNYAQNTSVVFNVTNATPFVHPFHMHGHNFFVLDEGVSPGSVWNGSVRNPQNPMRRDTHILPALGYAVFQIEATNPGVWPFHCHVAWHLSGGLAVNLVTRPDLIPDVPSYMPETCSAWDAYSAANVVDQIDAGS